MNSNDLRQEAQRYRRRAEDDTRWGNEELAALRGREFREQADRLESMARSLERKEGKR